LLQFDKIAELDGVELRRDVPWKKLTTLGVGTTADYVAYPSSEQSLISLLKLCSNNKIPFYVIGGGSNLVGADSFQKLVIKLQVKCMNDFILLDSKLTVGAAITNKQFVNGAFELGLGGIAPLAYIPGSIGGSLRMNAGAHGIEISDHLAELHVVDYQGNKQIFAKNDIQWNYRSSSLLNDVIITQAVFTLPQSTENDKQTLSRLMTVRNETNAKGRSAGCVFKNPSEDTSAGKLIDLCGCKGMSSGDAIVSSEHANFLVNNGDATENDFLTLALQVQKTVFDKTGVILKPEVEFADHNSASKFNGIAPTVAVLKGGTSSERDVSLESGGAVANALRDAGYNVVEVDIQALEVTPEMRNADIVFPVLHGGFGENGELQKLMEDANIEFVGCGSKACEIIMDKILSKDVMDKHNISGAEDVILTGKDYTFPEGLELPVVTKPPKDGSSFGVSLVKTMEEWKEALDFSYKYDDRLLVESYIDGVELTVGIVDGQPLPAVEIDYPGMMYDFDAKYTHEQGETYYHCPPKNISAEVHKQCQETAVKFFNAVGARDVTRVDIMVDKANKIHVLEGNNLPGFTASSLLPKSAKQSGLSFAELCAKLAHCAIKRSNND